MVDRSPAPSVEKASNGATEDSITGNTVAVADATIKGVINLTGFDHEKDMTSFRMAISSLEHWWVNIGESATEISETALPDAMDIIHGMGYFTEDRRKK